jgi:hypothetical protein
MALYISIWIGKAFNLAVGGYYFRRLPFPYRLVFYLTAVALLFECYGFYLGPHLHRNNSWLFNIYILLDAWLMGTAAIYLMNIRKRYFFFGTLVVETVIWLVNICVYSIRIFADVAMVAELALLTIMYLFLLYSSSVFKKSNILYQPVFWLSFPTILYCACDIPYFGLHNYIIVHAPTLAVEIAVINTILDILRYPLIAISFILLGRQKQVALNVA